MPDKDESSSEDEDVKFEWNSKVVEKSNGKCYYNSCSINGQIIDLNDNVAIKGENNEFYICNTRKLYNHPRLKDQSRATVCWFFSFEELPSKCKNFMKAHSFYKKELFKPMPENDGTYFAGCIEDIDAETIDSRCIINEIGVKDKPPKNIVEKQYFVRFGFKRNGEMCPVLKAFEEKVSDKTPARSRRSVAPARETPTEKGTAPVKSKRKASTSIPDQGKDIVVSKKNKKHVSTTTEIVSQRAKAFNAAEALGELMKDSDEDGFEESSDDESSLASEDKAQTKDSNNNRNTSCDAVCSSTKDSGAKTSPHDVEKPNYRMDSEMIQTMKKEPNTKSAKSLRLAKRNTASVGTVRSSTQTLRRRTQPTKDILISSNIGTFKSRKSESRSKSAPKQKKMPSSDSDDDQGADDGDYKPSAAESSESEGDHIKESESEGDHMKENHCVMSDEEPDESDAEDFTPKRKPAKQAARRKSANIRKMSTAVAKTPNRAPRSVGKRMMTPSISDRQVPCAAPKTPLEQARQRLHVSAVPESLPCREQEFTDIYSFIANKLTSDLGGCMYISGVPGTGKTATVHEVIAMLEEEKNEGGDLHFKYIEVNGMKLTEPNQAYSTFLKALTGQKASPEHASNLLEKIFSDQGHKREHVVLLVDELDLLWTRKQNVMYNLFEWPTRQHAKLIVLAIANTMDLPERIMMNRISSRLGLTRMTFQPYTFRQLQEIVYSRIRGIDAFEEDAMELIARKVAALSGDARRCLDICRRAVEIAESQVALGSPRKRMKGIVGMRHVNEALQEMFSSPKIIALKSLPKFQGFFMRAVVSEFRRSGLEEAFFKDIYDQFQDLCRIEGDVPPNTSEAFRIGCDLGSCKLLLVESGQNDIYQRIRLNVSQDDVLFALKDSAKKR